jgi:hypothetical protein
MLNGAKNKNSKINAPLYYLNLSAKRYLETCVQLRFDPRHQSHKVSFDGNPYKEFQ